MVHTTVHLYCLTYSTFVEGDTLYVTVLFIFLVTVFIKKKKSVRGFIARHVVCLSLTALGCKTGRPHKLNRSNQCLGGKCSQTHTV